MFSRRPNPSSYSRQLFTQFNDRLRLFLWRVQHWHRRTQFARRQYSSSNAPEKVLPIHKQVWNNFRKDPLQQFMHVILAGGISLYFNADKFAKQRRSAFEKSKGGQIQMTLDNMEKELSTTSVNLGDEDEINAMYEIINDDMVKYLLMDTADGEERDADEMVQGYMVLVEQGGPALLNHLRNRKHVIYLGHSTGKLKNDLINGLGLNRNSLIFETSDILDVMENALNLSKHYPIIVADGMHNCDEFKTLGEKLMAWSGEKKANVIFVNSKKTDLSSLNAQERIKPVSVAKINKEFVAQRLRASAVDLTEEEIDILVQMTGGEPDDIDEILQRRQIRGITTDHALNSYCKQDSEHLIQLLMGYPERKFKVAIQVLDEVMQSKGEEGVELTDLIQSIDPSFKAPISTIFEVIRDLIQQEYITQEFRTLKLLKPIHRNTMRCALVSPWVDYRISKSAKLSAYHAQSEMKQDRQIGMRMLSNNQEIAQNEETGEVALAQEESGEIFTSPQTVDSVRPAVSVKPVANEDPERKAWILKKEKSNFDADETSTAKIAENMGKEVSQEDDEEVYKIDIPANRYDLLCIEGLVRALKIFLQMERVPKYELKPAQPTITLTVEPATKQIRPFVVAAVLRNVTLNKARLDSCIDLQDKLHQNICRKRTLVAIGTHDLDTLTPPFRYRALPPQDIEFEPLEHAGQKFRADKLMEYYETNPKVKHIKPYVPIIKDSPVYPVIYDSNDTVLSLPPIINGDHSKLTEDTKNIFIECTATDYTKAQVVLNILVTTFSEYCGDAFTVEPVRVVYEDREDITPDLSDTSFTCDLDYINSRIGINISAQTAADLLNKMQLTATVKDEKTLNVIVPPTRADILHPCDIMEDVAIAYGYNNIVKTNPQSVTTGGENPLNKLSDMMRMELVAAGYTECLTLALCSLHENFDFLNLKDDGSAVKVDKPKTREFQCCRTSLLPGLLKAIAHNVKVGVPLKMFEVSDVILRTTTTDTGAMNRRRLAVIYAGTTSGFEIVHGVLDRIMLSLDVNWNAETGYAIKENNHPTYLQGRHADVLYKGKKIGDMGIIHPTVIENFGISFPVSYLEFDLQTVHEE